MPAFTYCDSLDLSNFNADEIIANDVQAWVAVDVEAEMKLLANPDNLLGGLQPHVVINLATPAFAPLCGDQQNINLEILNSLGNFGNAAAQINSGVGPTPQPSIAVPDLLNGDLIVAGQAAMGGFDVSSLNLMNFHPPAVRPLGAAIPMRTARSTYGPWATPNFGAGEGAYGGVEVKHNPDLNPWNYKSFSAMNEAAKALLSSSFVGLTRAETGTVTIPGLPEYDHMGIALDEGPLLSDMTTSFGSDGITTTYNFKTYTPKFGKLAPLWLTRFKQIQERRSEYVRQLKQSLTQQYETSQRIKNLIRRSRGFKINAIPRQASLNRILAGQVHNMWKDPNDSQIEYQRVMVGTDTMAKMINETYNNYQDKAFISLEGIFSPVAIKGDPGAYSSGLLISSFARPSGIATSGAIVKPLHTSIQAQPPFTTDSQKIKSGIYTEYNIDLYQKYFNPLSNPNSLTTVHNGPHKGHHIDIVGRDNEMPEKGLNQVLYARDDPDRYNLDDNYRFLGLKGPLVLHSWGYDTDGKPVPNEADVPINTLSGVFVKENLTDRFLENWLQKPSTWPAGPVDLRFDRERGVWVSPPPYKLVVAEITNTVPAYGTGTGILITAEDGNTYSKQLYDKDGNIVQSSGSDSEAKILIEDRLGISTEANTRQYAYFDSFTSTYLLMGGGSGGSKIKLGKYNGYWSNAHGRNVKIVTLYTQPSRAINPYDWVPETDSEGNNVTVVAVNMFTYLPSKIGSDRSLWCAVVPINSNTGWYNGQKYNELYLLIAAEG